MHTPISETSLDQVFRQARTHTKWQDRYVSDELLGQLYDLAKWGPTSMNCQPMRLVFVKSDEAKEKLVTALAAGNVDKVRAAPVTVIIGHDMAFHQQLKTQWPHSENADQGFIKNPALAEATAFRNGSLQGAYLLIAARALGLDTGPMSGFNNAKVDELFFDGTDIKSNFIMNIGYGDHDALYPRGPRLAFDAAASIQ